MSMDYFVEDIVPCVACICCILSLNASFPGCIGCSGKEALLCCHCNYFGCRVPEEDDRIWCHGTECHLFCAPIQQIYKNDSQLFCCDILCSLPLSKEIPSLITCCFFTIFYKNRCGPCYICSTIQKLDESRQPRPASQSLGRTCSAEVGRNTATVTGTVIRSVGSAADTTTAAGTVLVIPTVISTGNTNASTPVHPVLKGSSLDSDNDSEYYP